MPDPLRVGILGVGGYTGAELVRLLHGHPKLALAYAAAKERSGRRLADVLPSMEGIAEVMDLPVERFEPEHAEALAKRLDVVFSALPHGSSAVLSGALYDAGLCVVDLSADFRLHDVETYERWYGPHPRPDLLPLAVYGLPELHRDRLRGARLIAAPGCYPTSAVLALAPLLRERLVEPSHIIIDAKSGVSGAGRTATESTHYPECAEGLRPYRVGGSHRHLPEIEQELSLEAAQSISVVFTPHLVPMTRGILTTVYGVARPGVTAATCREAAKALYGSGLVGVLDEPRLPDTLWVRGSARALLAYALDAHAGVMVGFCAEDNLGKGAAAQAIQSLNIALGWPEALGLPLMAAFP